mmetsp:Transcript_1677/g.3945  ORF Transcript_1677/g.3945 Transcript_1677/m.3945 type:complete len:235 (+) Transcript_1677:1063-1767(+)
MLQTMTKVLHRVGIHFLGLVESDIEGLHTLLQACNHTLLLLMLSAGSFELFGGFRARFTGGGASTGGSELSLQLLDAVTLNGECLIHALGVCVFTKLANLCEGIGQLVLTLCKQRNSFDGLLGQFCELHKRTFTLRDSRIAFFAQVGKLLCTRATLKDEVLNLGVERLLFTVSCLECLTKFGDCLPVRLDLFLGLLCRSFLPLECLFQLFHTSFKFSVAAFSRSQLTADACEFS